MNDNKTSKTADFEEIAPDEKDIVVCGVPCKIMRMKTKQIFALLKLLRKMSEGELESGFSVADLLKDKSKLINILFLSADKAEPEFNNLIAGFLRCSKEDKLKIESIFLNEGIEIGVLTELVTTVISQESESLNDLIKKVTEAAGKMKLPQEVMVTSGQESSI